MDALPPRFRLLGVEDPLQDDALGRRRERKKLRECDLIFLESILKVFGDDRVLSVLQGRPGTGGFRGVDERLTALRHLTRPDHPIGPFPVRPAPVALRFSAREELIFAVSIPFVGDTVDPAEAEGLFHCFVVSDARRRGPFMADDEPDRTCGAMVLEQPTPPFLRILCVDRWRSVMEFLQ